MASRLHRQAALSSTLRAQHAIDKEYERALDSMRQKTNERLRRGNNNNWHEGRLAPINWPPTVYPIVVGSKSLFKSPEDLAIFLGKHEPYPSQTVFELSHDTEHKFDADPDQAFDILAESDLPNLFVCEVDDLTASDLQILTKGAQPLIWFEGERRAAWLPTSLQEVSQVLPTTEPGASQNVPAKGELLVLIGDTGGKFSVFKSAEDLRDFLHLSDLPRLIQTTATKVNSDKSWEHPTGKPEAHYRHYPSRVVACVNADQYRRVEDLTTGDRVLVWFPNNVTRYTWVPRALVSDDDSEDSASHSRYLEDDMGCGLYPWIMNIYKRIMRKFGSG